MLVRALGFWKFWSSIWFVVAVLPSEYVGVAVSVPLHPCGMAGNETPGETKAPPTETPTPDAKPEKGKTSYYYVRGEQNDGEIVWASPMWITYTGD